MSEDGFGTVPNALLDIKDARIAELEAALAEARYRIDGMITDHDETRAALVERERENATLQWLAREAIAATWPVRPSDETIESEYQELLGDALRARAEEGSGDE